MPIFLRRLPLSFKAMNDHPRQWRILRVFTVNSKKILFSNFLQSFLFFVIFVRNFVQKVSFTIFPFKII